MKALATLVRHMQDVSIVCLVVLFENKCQLVAHTEYTFVQGGVVGLVPVNRAF
jgi:hypothetical protein